MKYNFGIIFASIQIFLAIAAVIGYALQRDWKHSAYWFFAGCITATVTLLKG